ncbi:MAG: EAL domain-containing protein [Candidatus Brocadia sp.]|nr:EAL domain-containing protein [Candidatus Brocadia sp.]
MKKDKSTTKQKGKLRNKTGKSLPKKGKSPQKDSAKNTKSLLHELREHQVELEMQNENLRQAQTKIEESRAKYADLYDFAPVGYFTFDRHGRIIEVNLTVARQVGVERSFLINKPFFLFVMPEFRRVFHSHIQTVFTTNTRQSSEIKLVIKDGTSFYVTMESVPARDIEGDVVRCRSAITDISEHKRLEEKIKRMAYYDALTDLPNRVLFNDRLTVAIAHAHRNRGMVAVLFLDLDRFKIINDTMGHTVGDKLLQEVANRLKTYMREDDTIARFGGDEFSLLLPEISHEEDVSHVARKILSAFKYPWIAGGHEFYISASIGIALYPDDGGDAEILIKNADIAMYYAKEQGRNNYQFYVPAMYTRCSDKMMLEGSLRRALDCEEFVVYYQPLVDLFTGRIVCMEALVRWRHPIRGLLFPEEFLFLSENTSFIIFIDELVLYTVCTQIKTWQDAGFQPLCVAVNLSAHTFHQENFLEMITSVLKKTGINSLHLGLEITESVAMRDIEITIHKLSELTKLGIQISIDDFGTGFSSLAYLKKFPINKLKISQLFVKGILTDRNDQIIVGSIIALAKSLKLKVVAEGVENQEQLTFLKQRQCDEIQGYLFCKPLPAEEFSKISSVDSLVSHNVKQLLEMSN